MNLIIPVDYEIELTEGLEPTMDETLDRIEQDLETILEESGENIEDIARENCPFRTGYLQSTIFHEVDAGRDLTVGAEAEYASYVEYGTSKMEAQPFLEPAIDEELPYLNAQIDDMVADALADDANLWQDDPEVELELEMEFE